MDDRSSSNEALQFNNTFSNAAATAPRCRPAEQTGFGSGGTTSSSSTRSSKRQRGLPAQCPPGSYFDGSSIYTNPKDPHRGEGKQTGRHYDLSHSRELRMARSNTRDDHDERAIGRGDHDGEEEVARLARHARGTSGSPERRREGDGSTYDHRPGKKSTWPQQQFSTKEWPAIQFR